jgi:hypothetical protein
MRNCCGARVALPPPDRPGTDHRGCQGRRARVGYSRASEEAVGGRLITTNGLPLGDVREDDTLEVGALRMETASCSS